MGRKEPIPLRRRRPPPRPPSPLNQLSPDTHAGDADAPLDARMYPHLIDQILASASYDSLLVLRATSRELRASADALLCRYLFIRAPEDKTVPGVFVNTRMAYIWREEGQEISVPGFAFYPFIADRPYHQQAAVDPRNEPISETAAERAEEDMDIETASERSGSPIIEPAETGEPVPPRKPWVLGIQAAQFEALARRWSAEPPFVEPPPPETGKKMSKQAAAQQNPKPVPKAKRKVFGFTRTTPAPLTTQPYKWCAAALTNMHSLDVHGTFSHMTADLIVDMLPRIHTVRIIPDGKGFASRTVTARALNAHAQMMRASKRRRYGYEGPAIQAVMLKLTLEIHCDAPADVRVLSPVLHATGGRGSRPPFPLLACSTTHWARISGSP